MPTTATLMTVTADPPPEVPLLFDDYKERIGRRLRLARQIAGITQTQALEALDLGVNALTNWEAGRTMPRADQLGFLADLYHCSVDWIVGRPGADDVYMIHARAKKIIEHADDEDRITEALSYLTMAVESDTVVTSDPRKMWEAQAAAIGRLREIREESR